VEALERLLKGGADPNTCTNEGKSAFKLATSKDDYSIVQLLLKYGTDSTKLDANGSSPLEDAFSCGSSQIALALLEISVSND
jgi:ankyrin repeat protein